MVKMRIFEVIMATTITERIEKEEWMEPILKEKGHRWEYENNGAKALRNMKDLDLDSSGEENRGFKGNFRQPKRLFEFYFFSTFEETEMARHIIQKKRIVVRKRDFFDLRG